MIRKKIVATTMTLCLLVSPMASFAQGNGDNYEKENIQIQEPIEALQSEQLSQTKGTITKVEKEDELTLVTVKKENSDEEIIFTLDKEAYLVNYEGLPFNLENRSSDEVIVYHSQAMTKSIPAQCPVSVLIGDLNGEEGIFYAVVEEAIINDDASLTITTDEASRQVTINKDTVLSPWLTKNIIGVGDIAKGSKVLLWYDLMTLSYPALATAQKVVLLEGEESNNTEVVEEEITEPKLELVSDEMVPLRAFAENKGYQVIWIDGNIILIKDNSYYTLKIGEVEAGYNKMRLVLDKAPELREDSTYVPKSFIEEMNQD